jgi:DNA repair protein RadC
MQTPSMAAEFVRKVLPDNSREHFVVLHLDSTNQIISYAVVSTGTANSCPVHPREVFQGAVLVGAIALIVSHNHPTGDLTPSGDDRKITTRLNEAAALMGIKIHDHVIVTDGGFYSFAEDSRF